MAHKVDRDSEDEFGSLIIPMAIVMLAPCRNSDFFLRASQPEPPAASSFSRSSSKYGLTTVE